VEEEGIKPRTFLQKAGDICREYDENCFANWAIIKANKIYRNYLKNHDEDSVNPLCIIVSDVRYLNEAKNILKQPNGFVISFDADKEILDQRILKRDGAIMSGEQSGHSSEMEAEEVKQVASAVIDTNNMNLEQQVAATLECLGIGIKSNA
jgi:dephospho-CoA kinase